MADITYCSMSHDRFQGLTRNGLIRIASQMWEYRFGGDLAQIMRDMRDDFEVLEADRERFEFRHDGEDHIICSPSFYETSKESMIEGLIADAEYELSSARENAGWVGTYLTFDRDMFICDLEISGDADQILSPWDGVVEEMYCNSVDPDGKVYRDSEFSSLYTWRLN